MSDRFSTPYKAKAYSEADQRADTAFLVGANYGRALALADLQSQVTDVLREYYDQDDAIIVGGVWELLAEKGLALYDSTRGIKP